MRKIKRNILMLREREYHVNGILTEELRQSLHPSMFESILTICSTEHNVQKYISDKHHRRKLLWIISGDGLNQKSNETPAPAPKKITIFPSISSETLTPDDIALLEKGPKFIPSISKVDDKCLMKFNIGFQRLIHQIRWHESALSPPTDSFITCPDFKEIRRPPLLEITENKLKVASNSFQNVLRKIKNQKPHKNLSTNEWRSLTQLKRSHLAIFPSDKGGDFCVCSSAQYKEAIDNHLSDNAVYRKISFVDVPAIEARINNVWKNICQKRKIPKPIEIQFSSSGSSIAKFKGLVKTHKNIDPISIRPVVNTIGSPSYKLSWLLQKILAATLPKSTYAVKSSRDMMDRLTNIESNELENLKYPFSLDVVNMYTSVPRRESTDILFQQLQSSDFNYHGLLPEDIRELTTIILDNSFFKFDASYYKQMQGLPMGNKISGTLADVFINSIEMRLIPQMSIKFFGRYVDDCLILTNSLSEANNIFRNFNIADDRIKFEIEHPKNNKISLLDFTLQMGNNEPKFQPYKKAIRSDIFMNAHTALPTRTKNNIIINEWQRISSMCQTFGEKRIQRNIFMQKLKSNGYVNFPQLPLRNRHTNNPNNVVNDAKVLYLNIPFISDAVDTSVRRCFKHLKYNIRISHKGTNLNQLLNPNKKTTPTRNGKCSLKNCRLNSSLCYISMVVYEAKCCSCLKRYIGSTKKSLHLRVQEHFNHKDSNIYKHNTVCKGSWSFSVKGNSKSLQDLRWMEAVLIQQIKPEINKKEDMMSLSQFLLV
jgi:hypothetical protein